MLANDALSPHSAIATNHALPTHPSVISNQQTGSEIPDPAISSHFEMTQPIKGMEDVLATAISKYTTANENSFNAYSTSCAHMPGGNTRTVLHADPFPLTFATGDGPTLTDLDGHTYTDFLGEFTAGIYGHNNPLIRNAINGALDSGWSFGGNNVHEKALAKLVCERFRPTMELVRFCNSGTEANMMAIAAAVAWTERGKLLVFEKGYHGATLSFRAAPPGREGSMKSVNLPHEWLVGEYNDVAGTKQVLSAVRGRDVAAIIVEPMLGSGGAVPGDLEFLQFLRDYASEHGALLIFDEVMTSRLGYRGLGHQLGIQPDLMTLGKWVGGGMSFGAFGGRKDVMAMFDPRSGCLAHAGTFNNNVVSMAAGVAGCGILCEGRLSRLNALGERMKGEVQRVIDEVLGRSVITEDKLEHHSNCFSNGDLDRANKDHLHDASLGRHRSSTISQPPKMWISGIGSILYIHFAPSPISATMQSLFFHHMLTEGLYVGAKGFIALSLEITEEHVEKFVEATKRFLMKREIREMILG